MLSILVVRIWQSIILHKKEFSNKNHVVISSQRILYFFINIPQEKEQAEKKKAAGASMPGKMQPVSSGEEDEYVVEQVSETTTQEMWRSMTQ